MRHRGPRLPRAVKSASESEGDAEILPEKQKRRDSDIGRETIDPSVPRAGREDRRLLCTRGWHGVVCRETWISLKCTLQL